MAVEMNPYFSPILAVAGTLLGAIVTQVAVGRRETRALRQQREALEEQRQHGSLEEVRKERRRVYSAFYDAMERWNILVLHVGADVDAEMGGEFPSAGALDRVRTEYAEQQDDLWREWRSLDAQLQLLAGRRLQDAARDIFSLYMKDMEDAWTGRDPFARPTPRKVFPSTILFLMQEEIGVVGGRQIDPVTGLWRRDAYSDAKDVDAEAGRAAAAVRSSDRKEGDGGEGAP